MYFLGFLYRSCTGKTGFISLYFFGVRLVRITRGTWKNAYMDGIVILLAVALNENTISFAFVIGSSAQTDRLQEPQMNYDNRQYIYMFSTGGIHEENIKILNVYFH